MAEERGKWRCAWCGAEGTSPPRLLPHEILYCVACGSLTEVIRRVDPPTFARFGQRFGEEDDPSYRKPC